MAEAHLAVPAVGRTTGFHRTSLSTAVEPNAGVNTAILSARTQTQGTIFENNITQHRGLPVNNSKDEGSDKKMPESGSRSLSPLTEETAASLNLSNVSSTIAATSERAIRVVERRAQFKAQHGPQAKETLPTVQKVTETTEDDSDFETVYPLSDSEAEKVALTGGKAKRNSRKKSSRSCTEKFDLSYTNVYGINHPANENGTGIVRAAVGGPGFWNNRIGCVII